MSTGFATGLHEIDRLLQQVPGDAVGLLGARPGAGKTTLALDIAVHQAQQGQRVLYFSMEMSRDEILARMTTDTLQMAKDGSLPLHISDIPRVSFETLKQGVLDVRPHVVIVDYVQLLDLSGRRHSLAERLAVFADNIAAMARAEQVQVLLVAQLNRSAESISSNFRGTGALEQVASFTLVLQGAGETKELTVVKNRSGGVGGVQVTLNTHPLHFTEGTERLPVPPRVPRYRVQAAQTNAAQNAELERTLQSMGHLWVAVAAGRVQAHARTLEALLAALRHDGPVDVYAPLTEL